MADDDSSNEFSFADVSTDSILDATADDQPAAGRQKRKRTSPEDQAILETAYKRDPKPDKDARLELVKQVALSEKEVQIWFQNRRQSSRRKSGKPLLPHEIAQYQWSRSTPTAATLTRPSSHISDEILHRRPAACDVTGSSQQSCLRNEVKDDSTMDTTDATALAQLASTHMAGSGQAAHEISPVAMPRCPLSKSASASDPAATQSAITVGYLANRRCAPSLRHSLSDLATLRHHSGADQSRKLRMSTSQIRLSLNAEGKAEIVSKDASSPSPPRPNQTILLPAVGPERSQSCLVTGTGTPTSSNGRSRDSRSWEFWCDKEARSELGSAAEKDGSAAGAIGLLRTASGRSILGTTNTKRNLPFGNAALAKRARASEKPSLLAKSRSSTVRLQTARVRAAPQQPKEVLPKSSVRMFPNGPGSDKENHSPEPSEDSASESGNDHRRPIHQLVHARRRQLGSGSRGTMQNRQHTSSDPGGDAEVAAFMREESRSAHGSVDDDLCIQGLLSLSQGNWR